MPPEIPLYCAFLLCIEFIYTRAFVTRCDIHRFGQCSRRVCRSRSSSVDSEYAMEKHICKARFAASTREKAERMLREYSPRTSTYKCVDRIEGQDVAFDELKQDYQTRIKKLQNQAQYGKRSQKSWKQLRQRVASMGLSTHKGKFTAEEVQSDRTTRRRIKQTLRLLENSSRTENNPSKHPPYSA